MNPIEYALRQLRYAVPEEILSRTFVNIPNYKTTLPISVDSRIREQVIDQRVMVDCDLVGGVEVSIPLHGVETDYIDNYNTVFRIPPEMTQQRRITRALNVTYGLQSNGAGAPNPTSGTPGGMVVTASALLGTSLPIPSSSIHNLAIIGHNTVLVQGNVAVTPLMHLRCMVENDTNFVNLKAGSFGSFAQLVEFAVKAHIFTVNQIPMGNAFIQGGQELGAYKDIVMSYSDANENYKTYLKEVMRKVLALNDHEVKRRHVTTLVGSGW